METKKAWEFVTPFRDLPYKRHLRPLSINVLARQIFWRLAIVGAKLSIFLEICKKNDNKILLSIVHYHFFINFAAIIGSPEGD